MSCSSSLTTAGSTSRAASTHCRSTRSRTSSRPSGGRSDDRLGGLQARMKVSRELLDQIVAHVLEDPANEICGIVAVESDGAAAGERHAVRVYAARNLHLSPLRFEIDPRDLLRLSNEIDERGWEIGAIYHSH